jgi:hypothetical protein
LIPSFPAAPQQPFAVVVGLQVPWHLTNRRFRFSMELVDADGEQIIEPAAGDFEAGRPPGVRPGTSQRILMTFTVAPEFSKAGTYVFNALIDGEKVAQAAIEVVERPV